MSLIVKQAVNAIIRPPRLKYDHKKMPATYDIPGFGKISRCSLVFNNIRNMKMFATFYIAPKPIEGNPCVVYMHGNASNQLEGRYIVSLFLPVGINVFCFDFAGCGCSEGNYVSLGFFESQDGATVLQILKNDFHCDKIGLWGRSMGAVTALTLASASHQVNVCVADSPFISLEQLIYDIGESKKISHSIIESYLPEIKEKVKEKAGFDVDDVNVLDFISLCKTPVMFVHGKQDDFINCHNSEILFEKCASPDKKLILVEGGHNDDRPEDTLMAETEFLCSHLGIDITFERTDGKIEQNSGQHFSNVDDMLSGKK